ncbi:MAG: PIN domain-containing protein [Gemmatimonadota bacterium]
MLPTAAAMRQGQVVHLDDGTAIRAAEVASEYGMPMADSIIYATALNHSAEVWTQDADFEGLEQVRYVAK